MKIKTVPEDFVVDEILCDIPLLQQGPYALCLFKKKNANTFEELQKIARQSRIPFESIAYGGRKDRTAVTSQYITIHGYHPGEALHTAHSSITFLGYIDRPMGPDLIEENSFGIVSRDLSDEETRRAMAVLTEVRQFGCVNYFDDQRFGSYDPVQGFIAEKIVRKHYNGALKIYCTRRTAEDNRAQTQRKQELFQQWGDWRACRRQAQSGFERIAFEILMKRPKAFIEVLQKIPAEEMSLFFSAYQAYLWNEAARRMVARFANKDIAVVPGPVQDYLFYRHLDPKDYAYLRQVKMPLISGKLVIPDQGVKILYAGLLKEWELTASLFNLKKIRQAYFKGTERMFVLFPEDVNVISDADDMHAGKRKLTLYCTLPRGSYGTMIIKRLFAEIENK